MAQKTLLCVEPDEGTLATIRAAMEPLGFSVTNIPHGDQAIDWAKDHTPDLIVVSVEPRKVGYAVCNKIKRSNELKDIPLVLTSSEETPQTFEQHKKLKSRANEYLIKPFSEADLIAKIGLVVPLPSAPGQDEMVFEDEISIADGDIVEEKSHTTVTSASGRGGGPATAGELDAIFDHETDAAFAALQAVESTGTEGGHAEATADPPPAPWKADPEGWEAEATKATSLEEIDAAASPAEPALDAVALLPYDGGQPPAPEAIGSEGSPALFEDSSALAVTPPEDLALPQVLFEEPLHALPPASESRGVAAAGRIAELEGLLRDAASDRDRLAAENEELKSRRDSVQAFSRDKDVLSLRETINRKEKDILDLRDAVDAKDRLILDHKDRIREHERSRRDLEERSLGIEKQLMGAQERIVALQQDKDRASERERALKARLDDAHGDIQKAHDEIETLKKRAVSVDEKWRSDMDRTRGELESRILELEENHRAEVTRLTEERAATEAGLHTEHAEEVARLTSAHVNELDAEKRRAAEELAGVIDRLQGELARARKESEKALAALKEEQGLQLAAERQGHQAASEAKERDHKNEILGMRRRHEEELVGSDERRQRELTEAETRRLIDLEASENRRRVELQQRDEEHHALIAEMDRRHFAEKTETAERHRSEIDQAHARAARAEGELAARTEELAGAYRRASGLEADLDATRGDLRDRDVKLAQSQARIAELESKTSDYEDQIMRAFQRIRTDDKAIEKAKRALAVALNLLDDRGAAQAVPTAVKAAESGTT